MIKTEIMTHLLSMLKPFKPIRHFGENVQCMAVTYPLVIGLNCTFSKSIGLQTSGQIYKIYKIQGTTDENSTSADIRGDSLVPVVTTTP